MAELIIVLVIVVGLCGRRGQRWEWSRTRLHETLHALSRRGEGLVGRAQRSLPGVVAQCIDDVRSLVGDVLGILDPGARSRIARETRSFLAAAPGRPRRPATSATGSGLAKARSTAASAGPGEVAPSAFARLQRRYLDGSISLEEYITESRRLAPPARPG